MPPTARWRPTREACSAASTSQWASCIARSVLFLDEPTTGLDPEARVELWREIERLRSEEQMTILLTTHYMEEADRLAAEVAIIDRGRIVVHGTPERLKAELEGDTIQIGLAEADHARRPGRARAHPGTHAGRARRHRSARQGPRWRLGDPGGAGGPRGAAASTADTVTLARPTLDEVYLRHAGRAFHQSNDEPGEVAA